MTGWRFAIPPSLGREPSRAVARELADLLYDAGFATIVPYRSYAQLEEALLGGDVDAGWGPPLVCARVAARGGLVALRAIRWGATTYRSVLLCRADDTLDLRALGRPGYRRRPRAVWVDSASMAGYTLPRALLRSLGLDLARVFGAETVAGSYEACLIRVLDGIADVTATFASAARAARQASGHVELCGSRSVELRVLAYTDESPNDGVVIGPRLDGATAAGIREALRGLASAEDTRRLLARAFDVDGFDEPAPATYEALLALDPR